MPSLDAALLWSAAAVAAATVWTDLRRREIPHGLPLALAALWLAAAVLAPDAIGGSPWPGLLCGVGALALGFALYAPGWLGGADGKLMAALALWLGPADASVVLLAAAALLLLMAVPVRALDAGRTASRGLPFACALAPPAACVLVLRGVDAVAP